MKAIWKFPLGDDRKTVIKMPKDAVWLTVHEQFREGVIWAMVNIPDTPEDYEERVFESINTGREFELTPNHNYIGTYHIDGGNYVVHVFEVKK